MDGRIKSLQPIAKLLWLQLNKCQFLSFINTFHSTFFHTDGALLFKNNYEDQEQLLLVKNSHL